MMSRHISMRYCILVAMVIGIVTCAWLSTGHLYTSTFTKNSNKTDTNLYRNNQSIPKTKNIFKSNDSIVWSRGTTQWKPDITFCQPKPSNYTALLNTPSGDIPMYIYNPIHDIWISKRIVDTGRFDGDKINLIIDILEEDKELDFIDIGSNIGVYTLSVAKFGRQVLAVDALYLNVKNLCGSIKGNQFSNVKIVLNAISNEHTTVELGVDVNNMGGTFVDDKAEYIKRVKGQTVNGAHYNKVQTIEMDDLLTLPFISKFRKVFMKMDIEGFEARAIEKANWMFSSIDVQFVLMEWIFHRNKPSGQSICEFMSRHRMKPFHPTTQKMLPPSASGNWVTQDVLWVKNVS